MTTTNTQTNTKKKKKKKELVITGDAKNIERFDVGDIVRVNIEVKETVIPSGPHNKRGIITSLTYEDDEYIYRAPIVKIDGRRYMYNPAFLVIEQKFYGSPGDEEKIEEIKRKTAKAIEKAKNGDE